MKQFFCAGFVALLAGLLAAFACSSPTINDYCTGIPDGGCPGEGSYNCEDTTCAAIYSFNSACVWTFVQNCPDYRPPHDAGASDAREDGGDAGSIDVVLHDAGFLLPEGASGGEGCTELESPDCPLAMAVACGRYCCGCEALYVCVDGGWNVWGECDDEGAIVPDDQ